MHAAGLGPIPRRSISDYAREYGIENLETFRDVIRRLDTLYMEHHAIKD